MPTQITAHAISKSYDARIVLDGVACSFPVGECTGIVGENGSGKTTPLRLLAGREQPDQGRVIVTADAGVGYLPQDATLPAHLTEELERALADFSGALVVVSHDRRLRQRWHGAQRTLAGPG